MKRGVISLFLAFFIAGYAVQASAKIVTAIICVDNYHVLSWDNHDGSDLHYSENSLTVRCLLSKTFTLDVPEDKYIFSGGIQ